jgi:hypothetical protein
MVLATKKGLDLQSSAERKDYFLRIKDAVNRINKRLNPAEASAADQYRRAVSKTDNKTFRPDFAPTFTRPKRKRATSPKPISLAVPPAPKLDLSWKEGRTHFTKRSCRVGEDYQVSTIPAAGTHESIDNLTSDE